MAAVFLLLHLLTVTAFLQLHSLGRMQITVNAQCCLTISLLLE